MNPKMLITAVLLCGFMGGIARAEAPVAPEPEQDARQNLSVTIKAPIFSEHFAKVPVALVNDEPIFLGELTATLASLHGDRSGTEGGKQNLTNVLNRLINVRLVLQEAANMGLDDTPELQKQMAAFAESGLKEEVKSHALAGLKPDPAVVERAFQETAQEWKLHTVKFDSEAAAKALVDQVQAGGDFNQLVAQLVSEKKAEAAAEGEYIKPSAMIPQVAELIAKQKPGTISPVIKVGPAYSVVQLEEIRYPENAELRAAAEEQALAIKEREELFKLFDTLKKKYAKIDEKLFKTVNFDASSPEFKKLLKDQRPIAKIKGGKAVTVGDLATDLESRFYHGVDQAIKEKRVNTDKKTALDKILYNRIFPLEAKNKGYDKSESYLNSLQDYRRSLIFGTFVEKVVVPEVKVSDEEIAAFYKENQDRYATPELLKLKSLVFSRKDYAEAAAAKLRGGTDFQWLKENGEGVEAQGSNEAPVLDGSIIATKTLPPEAQSALIGVKAGDVRFYEARDGFCPVLVVQEVIAPEISPLAEVSGKISAELYGKKLSKAMDDWGTKLRSVYPVKIYLVDQSF
jgi:hypothetical protein